MLSDTSYGGLVPFDRAGMLHGSTCVECASRTQEEYIGIKWMCATEVGHTQQKYPEFWSSGSIIINGMDPQLYQNIQWNPQSQNVLVSKMSHRP